MRIKIEPLRDDGSRKVINPENATYSEWFNEYNWNDFDKCFLDRKEYGNYISAYIRNQKNGLVLNLNGGWGTGKTFFLKQLYTSLVNEKKKPTVYINAWESDFSNDPLLVIISELLDQMTSLIEDDNHKKRIDRENKVEDILSSLGSISKKLYNGSLDVAAGYLSAKNDDWETGLDATALLGMFSHLKVNNNKLELDKPKFGNSLKEDYKKQVKAISDIKGLMVAYAQLVGGSPEANNEGKIYILVDELDRCRPTYAIELLETIKHLFDIPNFVFVVATDTEQLSHSIKAVYGNDFNGIEYLSRFFNRTATLPQGDYKGLIKGLIKNTSIVESFGKGIMMPSAGIDSNNVTEREEFIINEVFFIGMLYEITPRKISNLIVKFESIVIESYENPNVIFDFRILLQLLAEYSTDSFNNVYLKRKKELAREFIVNKTDFNYPEKIKFLNSNNVNLISFLTSKSYEKIFKFSNYDAKFILLKYNLSWFFLLENEKIENYSGELRSYLEGIIKSTERGVFYSSKVKACQEYIEFIKEYHVRRDSNQKQFDIWSKDTYFRKVEISDSFS